MAVTRSATPKPRRARGIPLPTVGWREWVALPQLGIGAIKAKIDTGARTSALHAYDVAIIKRGRSDEVRFTIHPIQRNQDHAIKAVAPLVDQRWIRSSSGHRMLRPVILTTIELQGVTCPIEITLTNRDEMGFRMLLGREALRRRFLVDPGKSFVAGRPAGHPTKRKRGGRIPKPRALRPQS